MGAGVSAARRAQPPTPPAADAAPPTQPETRISPAAGVAVRGLPPPPGQPPRGPLFGIFGSRPTRAHLETTITTLVAELSAVKTRAVTAERDLQEAVAEAAQQGFPCTECVVCMAACVSTVLLPCGHLCLCATCAESMRKCKSTACPLCRVPVERYQRIYLCFDKPEMIEKEIEKTKEVEPDSPLGSNPASPTGGTDAGVQVSPSLRRVSGSAFADREDLLHPPPRVIKRTPTRTRPAALISARNDDDIIGRAIVRPAAYSAAALVPHHEASAVPEVRGSPEERPRNYDFVLPGSYVPDTYSPNPAFAQTWDGALRVRD